MTVQKKDWLPAPPEMSSSDIRNRLANGESVEGLLAPSVVAYIDRQQLYGV